MLFHDSVVSQEFDPSRTEEKNVPQLRLPFRMCARRILLHKFVYVSWAACSNILGTAFLAGGEQNPILMLCTLNYCSYVYCFGAEARGTSRSWPPSRLESQYNSVPRMLGRNANANGMHLDGPLVTFIVASKGRSTLPRTLNSLVNQTEPAWKALVIYDGVEHNDSNFVVDSRIAHQHVPKMGTSNHAGRIRNIGIPEAKTEWVAFVDDDDSLAPSYVQRLMQEIRLDSVDCVIFRMHHPLVPPNILPPLDAKDFEINSVGISFAMRNDLYAEGFVFEPGRHEDFVLLDQIRRAGRKMVISPYVTYYVQAIPYLPDDTGGAIRTMIN